MRGNSSGENKRKHLEMIQGVISRMSSNSFLFKGWSVTLITAISAFAAKDSNPALMVIPLVSTLLFWGVDAYYLMLERAFRGLYNDVSDLSADKIDFKMDLKNRDIKFTDWLSTLLRPVLYVFYGVVLGMLIILVCILNGINISVVIRHGA